MLFIYLALKTNLVQQKTFIPSGTLLYLCFVDLKKACDLVSRYALWILKALHRDTRGAVHAYGKVSKEFPIKNGVGQGYVLAPTLFNFFFSTIIARLWAEGVVHPRSGVGKEPKEDLWGAALV